LSGAEPVKQADVLHIGWKSVNKRSNLATNTEEARTPRCQPGLVLTRSVETPLLRQIPEAIHVCCADLASSFTDS
jgi:hypothetical protein